MEWYKYGTYPGIAMTVIGFVAQAKGIIPVLIVVAFIPALLSVPIVKKIFSLKS